MVLHEQVVHPSSLNPANQLKVVRLRNKGESWDDIAASVKNLRNRATSRQNAKNVYDNFQGKRSVVKKYKFDKCGRKPWKLTPAMGILQVIILF